MNDKPRDGASARRVAVVGAGIAGLTCARRLRGQGVDVSVFDKARGSGGRTSTRRGEDVAFDHGAQYFTARDPGFQGEVEAWERAGVVAEWGGAIVGLQGGEVAPTDPRRRLVGVPGMSSIGRHLAAGGAFEASFHVARIEREAAGLTLIDLEGRRHTWFDAVVLATPAPQAAALADGLAPVLVERARAVSFAPCWSVMLAFDARLAVDFDGAFVEGSPLSWVARNSSKPQRPVTEAWVLHGSPSWSTAHFDESPDDVAQALRTAFVRAIGRPTLPEPRSVAAHRWAYALPTEPLAEANLFEPESGLGVCGDWCSGPRVEGAYLSGLAMAERLLEV